MAFMTGLWNSLVGTKEIPWTEVSDFYFDKTKKYFSVSEVDKEGIPIVFGEAHEIAFNKAVFGLKHIPLSFVSIFYIDTRKGL